MEKKYLKKIIAQNPEDLQFISACCSDSKIFVSNIKFLRKNKVFLISLERLSKENQDEVKEISSVLKFDYIESSKSKNIRQNQDNLTLKLLGIDIFKRANNYEIILLFSNNGFITLTAEIIEVTLEDLRLNKNENNQL